MTGAVTVTHCQWQAPSRIMASTPSVTHAVTRTGTATGSLPVSLSGTGTLPQAERLRLSLSELPVAFKFNLVIHCAVTACPVPLQWYSIRLALPVPLQRQ